MGKVLAKRHLPQIKIFKVEDYVQSHNLESAVNEYVIEAFGETGNSPIIETTSSYISVIVNRLVDTKV